MLRAQYSGEDSLAGLWDTIRNTASSVSTAVQQAAGAVAGTARSLACTSIGQQAISAATQAAASGAGGAGAGPIGAMAAQQAGSYAASYATSKLCPKPTTAAPPPLPVQAMGLRMTSGFLPTSQAPGKQVYPQGAITKFNVSRRKWSVYAPASAMMRGLGIPIDLPSPNYFGGASIDVVELGNLGAAPAGYVKVDETDTQPGGVPVAGEEGQWYTNWKLWAGIGAGAAVLGGGYWYVKRR